MTGGLQHDPLEDIEAAALQQAPAERTHLVERLLPSLNEDDEILATWVEEAECRTETFDRGEIETIEFDEAIAQARARARISSHKAA